MSTTSAARCLLGSLWCVLALTVGAASARTPAEALADWDANGRLEGLARPDTDCQDFLQAIGGRPDTLEYLGCDQDDASYLQPMTAHYRVSGASAADVETYLQQTFGMPALTYLCCGWSSGAPYVWRAGEGSVAYEIGMGVESLHHPREQWAKIPSFAITVGVTRKSP